MYVCKMHFERVSSLENLMYKTLKNLTCHKTKLREIQCTKAYKIVKFFGCQWKYIKMGPL